MVVARDYLGNLSEFEMNLPNGDKAVVDDAKLYRFLVNRQHPRQAGHAELFHRLLGIDESNAELLRSALLKAASGGEVDSVVVTPYGPKYRIRFSMSGQRGTFVILSVWMIREETGYPSLVTAFVE